MEMELISSERHSLTNLAKYLNYELSSSVLFVLIYVSGIAIALLITAAILFSLYMVYIFIKENKIAWFVSFLIVVIIN